MPWVRSLFFRENRPTASLPTTAGDETFSNMLRIWVYPSPQNDREPSVQTPRPSADLSWFGRVMEPASAPLKPADIVPVIAGLTNLLKANRFEEVDRLLKLVKVRDAAPEMMVALLRTTYPAHRERLRHWSKLLREVRAELSARHLDSEKILRGLA
jgi:hypothetical protein